MHRFWVAATQISKGRVRFTREQAHQIARVLRLRSGDTVAVFDGTGTEHEVELISARVSETTGLLRGRRATMPEPVSRLVLLQGLPKREKMELIVQKATELGIHRVVPVLCERSVTRGSGRLVRWRLIAQEASEQCGRAVVPRVDEPIPLLAFFATEGRGGLRGITLREGEQRRGLKEALRILAGADTWHLLVGPKVASRRTRPGWPRIGDWSLHHWAGAPCGRRPLQ